MVDDSSHIPFATPITLIPSVVSLDVTAAPPDLDGSFRVALYWDFDGFDAIWDSNFLDRVRADAACDHVSHAVLFCGDRLQTVGNRSEYSLA